MSVRIPKELGVGGAGITTPAHSVTLKDVLNAAAADIATIMDKFSTHQHRYDGTQTTNAVTSLPVTGGTPGGTIATGGTLVGTVSPTLLPSTDAE